MVFSMCTFEGPQPVWSCRKNLGARAPFGSTEWEAGKNTRMSLSSHRCGTGRTREGSLFLRNLLVASYLQEREGNGEGGGWRVGWSYWCRLAVGRHPEVSSFTVEAVGNSWRANPNKSGPAYNPTPSRNVGQSSPSWLESRSWVGWDGCNCIIQHMERLNVFLRLSFPDAYSFW